MLVYSFPYCLVPIAVVAGSASGHDEVVQELVQRRRGGVDVTGTILQVTTVRPDGVVEVAQAAKSGDVEVLNGGVGVAVVEPLGVDDVGVAHHASATERTQGGDASLPTTDDAVDGVELCAVMHEDGAVLQAAVQHFHHLRVVKRVASRSEVHLVGAEDVRVGTHVHRGQDLLVLHDVVVPNGLRNVELPIPVLAELRVDLLDEAVDGVDEEGVKVSPSGLDFRSARHLVHASFEEVLCRDGSLMDTGDDASALVIVDVAVGHELLAHVGQGLVHAVDEVLYLLGISCQELCVVLAVGFAKVLVADFLVHHRGLRLVEVAGREVCNRHGVCLGVTLLNGQGIAKRRTHVRHNGGLDLTHGSGDGGEAVGVVFRYLLVDDEVLSPSGEVVHVDEVGVVQNLVDDNTTFGTEDVEVRGFGEIGEFMC